MSLNSKKINKSCAEKCPEATEFSLDSLIGSEIFHRPIGVFRFLEEGIIVKQNFADVAKNKSSPSVGESLTTAKSKPKVNKSKSSQRDKKKKNTKRKSANNRGKPKTSIIKTKSRDNIKPGGKNISAEDKLKSSSNNKESIISNISTKFRSFLLKPKISKSKSGANRTENKIASTTRLSSKDITPPSNIVLAKIKSQINKSKSNDIIEICKTKRKSSKRCKSRTRSPKKRTSQTTTISAGGRPKSSTTNDHQAYVSHDTQATQRSRLVPFIQLDMKKLIEACQLIKPEKAAKIGNNNKSNELTLPGGRAANDNIKSVKAKIVQAEDDEKKCSKKPKTVGRGMANLRDSTESRTTTSDAARSKSKISKIESTYFGNINDVAAAAAAAAEAAKENKSSKVADFYHKNETQEKSNICNQICNISDFEKSILTDPVTEIVHESCKSSALVKSNQNAKISPPPPSSSASFIHD